MNWLTLPAHSRLLENHMDALLTFAQGSYRPQGGFGWMDDAGQLCTGRGAELWITCRMTHVFALGALAGRPGCASFVDHGIAALTGPLADQVNGGWHGGIDLDPGQLATMGKESYAHGFVILAAASALAAQRDGAEAVLERALAASLERFWSEADGMVADRWDTTFTNLESYRGVNANMHTVEAYLAAADVTGQAIWRDRALRIIDRVVNQQARAHDWRIPEHYDSAWRALPDYNVDLKADKFRPYGATPGHGLEWSRLVLEAAAALGGQAPSWMVPAAQALYARAVGDGWAPDGQPGFVYTTDWDGQPVVSQRLHWVLAEAIGAAATLYRATGQAEYASDYQIWWDWAARALIDPADGSWVHELNPDGSCGTTIWDGKPDTYHAIQATLIPRLPLSPVLAPALAAGLLDQG